MSADKTRGGHGRLSPLSRILSCLPVLLDSLAVFVYGYCVINENIRGPSATFFVCVGDHVHNTGVFLNVLETVPESIHPQK